MGKFTHFFQFYISLNFTILPSILTCRAIVLRAVKYGETSLILDMLTEARGRRSFIIGGVRKANARISEGLLRPMALLDIVAYDRPDRELNRLKEVRPELVYRNLPFDLLRGTVGLFMIELVQKTVRESEENTPLFEFIFSNFSHLDRSTYPVHNWHLGFSLHLAGFLGFAPTGLQSEETPYFDLQEGRFSGPERPLPHGLSEGLSTLISELLQIAPEDSHQVTSTRAQRQELAEQLVNFFRLHVEGFSGLNTLPVLRSVMR